MEQGSAGNALVPECHSLLDNLQLCDPCSTAYHVHLLKIDLFVRLLHTLSNPDVNTPAQERSQPLDMLALSRRSVRNSIGIGRSGLACLSGGFGFRSSLVLG